MYDWPHETTPAALARNREGVAKFAKILAQANGGIRAYAETAGLKVDWEDPNATVSKLAWLTQTPREFDLKVLIGPRSSITRVHFMMGTAGRKWSSPGSD